MQPFFFVLIVYNFLLLDKKFLTFVLLYFCTFSPQFQQFFIGHPIYGRGTACGVPCKVCGCAKIQVRGFQPYRSNIFRNYFLIQKLFVFLQLKLINTTIMKKILFILCSLFFSVAVAMGQTNPKPGYVITNAGDTIRGTIDFRTNDKLAKECAFWANGESEGKTYKPGDIEGFRFEHNGKFFVTRRLNLYGNPELFFAEFMVQGKMNLYCVADKYDEFFFFEREDGEMEQLISRSVISSSSLQDAKQHQQTAKEQYGKVRLLLKDSWTAVDRMNDMDMSRKKLVEVVRDYHKDVCTDGSSCIVYEYKEQSDRMKSHIKAFAGYAYFSHEQTVKQNLEDETYHGGAFEVGLGTEVDIERMMKGGSAELGLSFSPKTKFEHDTMVRGGHSLSHTTYEKGRISAYIGVVKRFGQAHITPLVRGGAFYVYHFGNHETRVYQGKTIVDEDWENTAHFGAMK